MSKLLTSIAWTALKPNLASNESGLRHEIDISGRKNRKGKSIKNCISKIKAIELSTASSSLGVLVQKRTNNNGYKFSEYKGGALGRCEFAIETAVIQDIFTNLFFEGDTQKNSLIFFLFDADSTIFELSGDSCNGDDSGGDGFKIKLP